MPGAAAYREDIATEDELDHVDTQEPTTGPDDLILPDDATDPTDLAELLDGIQAAADQTNSVDLAARVLALAARQRGDVEHPAGSDRNKFTDWWRVRAPWCAVFALWVADQVADRALFPWSASCSAQVREWRARGRWFPATDPPQPGDLFYVRGGPTGVEHVGFVVAVDDENFWSIEGSWGNSVRRVRRNRRSGHIAGFGRPDYTGAAESTYVPFPGTGFFQNEPCSAMITRMGRRLVQEGCTVYEQGPGPQWTRADQKSYSMWQRRCGLPDDSADGWPDAMSWRRLRVPKA